MKKKFIIAMLVICVAGLAAQYVHYGSFSNNCIYTEREIVVPRELSEGVLELTHQYAAVLTIGANEEYQCLPLLGKVAGTLVGAADSHMHTPDGQTNQNIPEGTKYKVVQVLEVTKHGIGTIDSGGGPIYYLILKDGDGHQYYVPTVGLGINESDRFFKFTTASSSTILAPQNFPMYVARQGDFSFTPNLEEK